MVTLLWEIAFLQDLEISVSSLETEDEELRGVALAGLDLQSVVLVNTRHPMNQRESGRRFTLAHEICHVLHDRGYANRVALVSGPWAPPGVERRSNALAAMLLPPDLVNRLIAEMRFPDVASVNVIEELSPHGHRFLGDAGALDQHREAYRVGA